MSSKVNRPIDYEWKIRESELQLSSSVNGSLDSTVFYVPDSGIQCFLEIYPNGNNEERRGRTYIFLSLEFEGKKDIKTEFSFSIASANFTQKMEYVFAKSDGRGFSFCTTADLFDPVKQFIVGGEMVIRVGGFLMVEKKVPVKLCKLGGYGIQLCIALWNRDNKDFTIVADKKEIQAHKIILSTQSPVFTAMFQPHTLEAKENKVIIPDFTFDVVEAAIKFCYDSSLVEDVSFDDQMALLQFFDKYDMDMLKIDLEKHFCSEVRDSNVCLLANCSIDSNSAELRKKCFDHLQKSFLDNKLPVDFDILDKDFAVELLKNSVTKLPL